MSSLVRMAFRNAMATLAFGSLLATAAPNYQGIWWNSPAESESGWGINFAHQGDTIFATWFTYDAIGRSWWLAMTANRMPDGTYGGALIETRGPAFSAAPFEPAKVTRSVVGTGTLAFQDADNGTFSYTLKGLRQTKAITRLAFGPQPTCAPASLAELAAATNYQDLWWVRDGEESGWGINLAHDGSTLFATWFTYDEDGLPLWLAATAAKSGPDIYSGELVRTVGPAFGTVPFNPAKVVRVGVGTATFRFATGNAANFEYTVNGVTQRKAITRLLFAPAAGTRCGEPYRAPPTAPVSAVIAGDIAQCRGLPASRSPAAATAALVLPRDALVLTLGDTAYENGTADEFASCFQPTWGVHKDRIRPIPGNHDYDTPGAAAYYDYFGEQAGPSRRGYYSFDLGGWHFIALNALADFTPASEQYRWLVADLEASRGTPCALAMLHFPAFNSGATHGGDPAMKPVFDLLQKAGVELLLSGHEHVYERFAPQRADGTADPGYGLRQFVIGTGGAELMRFRETPDPNSEFRHEGEWGVLRLALGRGSYGWQFVTASGADPIDAGTGLCHR